MLKKMAIVGAAVAVTGLGLGGAALAQATGGEATIAAAGSSAVGTTNAPITTPMSSTSTPGTATFSTASSTSSAPAAPSKKAENGKRQEGKRDHRGRHGKLAHRLGNVAHAQWVSKDASGQFVTHSAIHGSVTAISPTSITVKAPDGFSQTFKVSTDTKVHLRGDRAGKAAATPGTTPAPKPPTASTIGAVKVGAEVKVLGTGTGTVTATRVHVASK